MLSSLLWCTVYDAARLADARVLERGLRDHHPDDALVALFVGTDEPPPWEGVETLTLDDLPDGPEAWQHVALSPPALRDRVLMGPLLATVAARGEDTVGFLSCALRVTAPLTPLVDAVSGDAGTVIAFVPMVDGRLPDDGRHPAAAMVSGAGLVNPRVLVARSGAALTTLLAGWPAFSEPEVDERPDEFTADAVQRHLDRAATSGTARVIHDPGLGLAYWNLALREVQGPEDALTAAGAPVRLLDLSGFDAEDAAYRWRGQDRVRMSAVPGLDELLRGHAAELLEGAGAIREPPFLADFAGRPLDRWHRELLREALAASAVSDPPWTPEGLAQWDTWLSEPAGGGAALGLTRYHLALWDHRADLREAYPHPEGPDAPGFAEWLATYGTEQQSMPSHLLPEMPERPAGAGPAAILPWGVNVAGFFRSELGLGEAARLLIAGLDAATVPALPVQGTFVPPCRQEAEFTFTTPAEAVYPINILCLNGDLVPTFAQEAGPGFFAGRKTIALWWWEIVDAFPADWVGAFDHVDEIWVATEHIQRAIAPHSPVPVVRIPLPVVVPRVRPFTRAELGFPDDGFVFFFMFDYHSTAARKNPVGHVEAFKRAFPPGSGAKLVLKCINADRMPAQHDRTLLAIGDHPDIHIVDRYVTADQKTAMIAAADCYVSLHRSEGFGLTPAEAMALGKPVIATRYGGVLDFMNDENGYLVDCTEVKVGKSAHPYPADGTWAEPDLDHAARLMREVVEDPEGAARRGAAAAQFIREHHAPAAAGLPIRARLQLLYDRLSAEAPALGLDPGRAVDRAAVDGRMAAGLPAVRGATAPAKRPLRSVTARALAPWLDRQTAIDRAILASIDELHQKIDRVAHEIDARASHHLREERAQTLAALRRARGRVDDHERWLWGLQQHLTESRTAFEHHLAEHGSAPWMSTQFERWEDPVAGPVEGFRTPTPPAASPYRAFEDRFRGPRGHVIEAQRPYASLLEGYGPVLDCGCGRGELLEVLREAGIPAAGVDLDEGMVTDARAAGLEVSVGDAVAGLRETTRGSLGGVTAMQVIEHLPYPVLLEFLRAAEAALRRDGRLVVETVNPYWLPARNAFWVDPTHEHPLFPEVVLELCREAGFASGFVRYTEASGDLDHDRAHSAAYAIVAQAAPAQNGS
jgi:glycosyltransferase involved in cell wall biosynthesis/SAM-dependent methyltransferase